LPFLGRTAKEETRKPEPAAAASMPAGASSDPYAAWQPLMNEPSRTRIDGGVVAAPGSGKVVSIGTAISGIGAARNPMAPDSEDPADFAAEFVEPAASAPRVNVGGIGSVGAWLDMDEADPDVALSEASGVRPIGGSSSGAAESVGKEDPPGASGIGSVGVSGIGGIGSIGGVSGIGGFGGARALLDEKESETERCAGEACRETVG
jgi:hypothetical protein